MKILSREEEDAHYRETLKGGFLGGFAGLGIGVLGVYAFSRRYALIRHLTTPMKAFLVTSSGTFGAIVIADRYSRSFEAESHPEYGYQDSAEQRRQALEAQQTGLQRSLDWARQNRYSVIGGSWVASMAVALTLVNRNRYLSASQKIVQARMAAQGLTIAVVLATAALEIGDRRSEVDDSSESSQSVHKQPHRERYAGQDQWKDMIVAEEQKLRQRKAAIQEIEEKDRARKGRKKPHHPAETEAGKTSKTAKSKDTKSDRKDGHDTSNSHDSD